LSESARAEFVGVVEADSSGDYSVQLVGVSRGSESYGWSIPLDVRRQSSRAISLG